MDLEIPLVFESLLPSKLERTQKRERENRLQNSREESNKRSILQYAGEIDPSFAGKPNLKRPLKGETTPRGSRLEAESLSSSDTDQV